MNRAIESLAAIGAVMGRACSPLWRAWGWVTGRRTLDLAWLLHALSCGGAIVYEVTTGSKWRAASWLVWAAIGAMDLSAVGRRPPDSDVLDARAEVAAMFLFAIAALDSAFVVFDVIIADVPRALIIGGVFLTCLAGAVDQPGGGKSCLRRAAERVAEVAGALLPRPATGAA